MAHRFWNSVWYFLLSQVNSMFSHAAKGGGLLSVLKQSGLLISFPHHFPVKPLTSTLVDGSHSTYSTPSPFTPPLTAPFPGHNSHTHTHAEIFTVYHCHQNTHFCFFFFFILLMLSYLILFFSFQRRLLFGTVLITYVVLLCFLCGLGRCYSRDEMEIKFLFSREHQITTTLKLSLPAEL